MNQRKYGVQCNYCKQVLISISRHDFNHCRCGDTFVDGGDDYTRVGYQDYGYTDVVIDMINEEIWVLGTQTPIRWQLLYNAYCSRNGVGPEVLESRWPY